MKRKTMPFALAAAVLCAAGVALIRLASPAAADDVAKIDFVKDVQPIFRTSCVKCHGVDLDKPRKKASGGFRIDDKAAAFKGGKSGAAIIPGDSGNSLLFKLLSGPVEAPDRDDGRDIPPMPKVKHGEEWKALPNEQIATIRRWIDEGARWPD